MKRKLISIILTLCMCLSLLPAVTLSAAAYSGGDGASEATAYEIKTVDDLTALKSDRDNWDKCFKLVDDIDLTGVAWTRIGNYSVPFSGTFDGGGHTIKGLEITTSSDSTGLFGEVNSGGAIKNLNVIGNVKGGANEVGGIVGLLFKGTVTNCSFNGTVTGTAVVGGIVGQVSTNGKVSYCHNNGTVINNGNSSMDRCTGGVAGRNSGATSWGVENCYNTGNVTGDCGVGGVVGSNSGPVLYCYNTGTVTMTGGDYAGGVAGTNTSPGSLTHCYNIGKVSAGAGTPTLGGVVGRNGSTANVVADSVYLRGTADNGIGSGNGAPNALYACQFAVEDNFSALSWNFYEGYLGMWGQWKMGENDSGPVRPILREYPESSDTLVKLDCTCEPDVDGTCNDCGIVDCQCMAGSEPDPGHQHSYGDTWTPDANNPDQHYRQCTAVDCPDREGSKQSEPHVYDDNQDTTCDICGYTRTPAHRHSYGDTWTADAGNPDQHYRQCTAVDCPDREGSKQSEPHVYDDNQDTTCDICGYTRTPAHQHSYGDTWTADTGNPDQHFRQCTAVDCPDREGSKQSGPHIYDNDQDTTCDTCGYTRSATGESTTYTVTFNSQGGSGVASQSVPKGGKATRPADPTRTGYTFKGWYKEAACTTPWDFSTDTVNANTTLYAKWEEVTYTVRFNTQGGSAVADQTVAAGGKAARPADPTRGGYTFGGWYKQAACTTAWDFGKDTVTKDTTIYAKWVAKTYDITGKVTDINGNALKGVHVALKQGNKTAAPSTTTNDNGVYKFTNIATGSYNVVATQIMNGGKNKIMTILVTIVDTDLTDQDLTMPSDNVNSVLAVKDEKGEASEEAPAIVVGGLGAEAENVAREEADKAAGGNKPVAVTVTMTLAAKEDPETSSNPSPDDQTAAEIAAIKEKANETAAGNASGAKLELKYLEIKVEKTVEIEGEDAESSPMEQTTQILTIVYPLDAKMKNADDVTVYRYHDGEAKMLSQAGSEGGPLADGTFRLDAENVYIYTNKFSTYAISYTVAADHEDPGNDEGDSPSIDTPAPPNTSGTPSSGGSSDDGPTTYPATVSKTANGSVSVSPSSPRKGDTVTITPKPDGGFKVGKVVVKDSSGKELKVTDNGDGTFSFEQPAGKVTVSVSFVKISGGYADCPKDSTCPIWLYTDASVTAWYHDGVQYCIEHGLMVGYDDGTFKPDLDISRAMIASILWRLEGSPVVNYAMSFADVAGGEWHAEAIRWAASEGIVSGYDGVYKPNDAITREQLASMLYRYARYKGDDTSAWTDFSAYTDVDKVSDWAMEAMRWANAAGIVAGSTTTTLSPKGTATRAMAAAMIQRFAEMGK